MLEVADNVVKARREPQDDHWQRTGREFISRHPWSATRPWALHESLITQFEPKATVMVQVAFSGEDRHRWAGYMTKAWDYGARHLAERRSVAVEDPALEWFELRDFFP